MKIQSERVSSGRLFSCKLKINYVGMVTVRENKKIGTFVYLYFIYEKNMVPRHNWVTRLCTNRKKVSFACSNKVCFYNISLEKVLYLVRYYIMKLK